jgi:hypothetical protein
LFGGGFDIDVAVTIVPDDTVDHVVVVIGMMMKHNNLTNTGDARQFNGGDVTAVTATALTGVFGCRVMGIVDEQIDTVSQLASRLAVGLIEILDVRYIGQRMPVAVEAKAEG